jgi:glyoxylase-like metal-dependent hydrolase (beta-lactamase superfamily II)
VIDMLQVLLRAMGILISFAVFAPVLGSTMNMRVFQINDYLLAFYDGRPPDIHEPPGSHDWAAYGAFNVGVCTYAIHRGDAALIYDTYPSTEQALWVRDYLAKLGIKHFTVVNSHWHLDHVGGNAVYADVDRLATQRTIEILRAKKGAIEAGTEWGPPAIKPLIVPNIGITHDTHFYVGDIDVELRPINIHSADGLVAYLPSDKLLLAGDTLEDTVTFISEPEHIAEHVRNLEALKQWDIKKILPNHGNPATIAAGGYSPTLIDATLSYLKKLTTRVGEAHYLSGSLEDYVGDSVARGWVSIWWAYREAHANNLKRVAETLEDHPAPPLP